MRIACRERYSEAVKKVGDYDRLRCGCAAYEAESDLRARLQHAQLRKADRERTSLHTSATPKDSEISLAWLIET
jgi:hypothetical protein